jgi:hypothetical protein
LRYILFNYYICRNKQTKKLEIMEATILNNLKENKGMVENRFNSLNENAIISKKDFFQIVFDHFEGLSKVMTNKVLKSFTVFVAQLNVAVEKAESKAHEINRENNYKMMVNNQRTNNYNG